MTNPHHWSKVLCNILTKEFYTQEVTQRPVQIVSPENSNDNGWGEQEGEEDGCGKRGEASKKKKEQQKEERQILINWALWAMD